MQPVPFLYDTRVEKSQADHACMKKKRRKHTQGCRENGGLAACLGN